MEEPPLYLASASPRRRTLLKMLGRPFTVGVAPVDEPALESCYDGPAEGLGEYLARHKALAAARNLSATPTALDTLVLGADTTVVLEGRTLGKPRDLIEAECMLRSLRDRTHTVVTGVALVRVPPSHFHHDEPDESALYSTTVITRVYMRDYSDMEMAVYLKTGDSLDKAGGYGVQHGEFQPVASVEGCYLCVVGLPMCAVAALLSRVSAGIPPTSSPQCTNQDTGCAWSEQCRNPLPAFIE